MAQTESCV